MAARTVRRFVVGTVGPQDVEALQHQIATYRDQLESVIGTSRPLPTNPSDPHSMTAWLALVDQCHAYESETTSFLQLLFVGSQYERGRQLLTKLDSFRDYIANAKTPTGEAVPNVPPPIQVPGADTGIVEQGITGLGTLALLALGAFLLIDRKR